MPALMFEDIEAKTPEISTKANYWFVRTNHGELYQAFVATNSIAIGYPAVGIKFVEALKPADASKEELAAIKDVLKNEIKKHYPPKEQESGRISDLSGVAASQVLRFCVEMKRGDIVLSPSVRTERISIGFVDDDAPFEEMLSYNGQNYLQFTKRRKVRWVSGIDRWEVNPNLNKLFLDHHTIADAKAYSAWIDALLYDFFKKGEGYHYVVKVRTGESISAPALFGACLDVFALAEEFGKYAGIELSTADIKTRANLNSPGDVELWIAQHGVLVITTIALIFNFLAGGRIGIHIDKLGLNIGSNSDGLIAKLNEFLDGRADRKLKAALEGKIDNLKVEKSKQLVDILKAIKDSEDEKK